MTSPAWAWFPSVCPWCLREQDASTLVDGEQWVAPVDGDVSICLYCARPSVFTGHRNDKRLPSGRELAEILADPEVVRAVDAVLRELGR